MESNEPRTYTEKYILYLDILGFKDYILHKTLKADGNMDSDQIYRFPELLASMMMNLGPIEKDTNPGMNISSYLKEAVITQFSDSIAISFPKSIKNLQRLALVAARIFWTGIHYEFVFSGSIVQGKIIHSDNSFYGPGYLDALNLQKEAIYPRIVIDVKSLEEIKHNGSDLLTFIEIDKSRIAYLNLFKTLCSVFTSSSEQERLLDRLRSIIGRETLNTNLHVRLKYEWLNSELIESYGYVEKHKGEREMRLS